MQIKKMYVACGMTLLCIGGYNIGSVLYRKYAPIKVGVLYSLTGLMASNELPVVDAILLAIEELNANGGLLGRMIKPIVADGASNEQIFAQEAQRLITEENVQAIFGCWTSASRKSVKSVVEEYNNLLFYVLQYEGAESSPNIIYTGAVPNQQLFPGILWCLKNLGTRLFIIGSDYIYPRVTSIVIADLLNSVKNAPVGETFISLTAKDVGTVVEDIIKSKADVIINLLNGEANQYFFKALRAAGITSSQIPTISFSIGENEIESIGIDLMVGDYASWSYFQSVKTKENSLFVDAFKKRYGQYRTLNDPMESGYASVYLWSQVVKFISSSDPVKVLAAAGNQSRTVPEGIVSIDQFNHNMWKMSRIGKINAEGQFDIMWSSEKTIYPVIYPFRLQEEWEKLIQTLYTGWGNAWSKK